MRFQNEKLMALGKLSAGLAHELNNPASAMVRHAQQLYDKLHSTPEKFKAIMTMRITPEQTDQVNEILFSKLENLHKLDLAFLERNERTEELLDWLDDHGVEDGEDIADTFAEFGLKADDLDRIEGIIGGKDLGGILWWLESTLSMEKLVNGIQDSAGRIRDLIQSVKQYSYMDRGVSMENIDVHEGIRNTLVMLEHTLKKQKIELEKDFDADLPALPAYPGELNQVWTNLICNATDAMEEGGRLLVRSYRDRDYASGPGIPEEHLTRIFDPFFTTKPMGKGTGMGLEIVQRIVDRHRADIRVDSRPGKTTFTICLPLRQRS